MENNIEVTPDEKHIVSLHFLRLAYLNILNLNKLFSQGYSVPFIAFKLIDENKINTKSISHSLPSPEFLLIFQLIISTLEKFFKSLLSFQGDLNIKLSGSHDIKKLYNKIDEVNNIRIKNKEYEYKLKDKIKKYNSLLENLFKLDYVFLRYESKIGDKPIDDFSIDFTISKLKEFVKFIETEIYLIGGYFQSKIGESVQYPKNIKPIIIGFTKFGGESSSIETLMNPDIFTITNKIKY